MNKDEFLKQLMQALHALDVTERARTVQYYREILEDRIEDGLTEEAAVAEMESIDDIVAGILSDAASRGKLKQHRSAWNVTLLILGSRQAARMANFMTLTPPTGFPIRYRKLKIRRNNRKTKCLRARSHPVGYHPTDTL